MNDNEKTNEDLAIENRALRVYIAILEGTLDEALATLDEIASQTLQSSDD